MNIKNPTTIVMNKALLAPDILWLLVGRENGPILSSL